MLSFVSIAQTKIPMTEKSGDFWSRSPRGERGLKFGHAVSDITNGVCRSPRGKRAFLKYRLHGGASVSYHGGNRRGGLYLQERKTLEIKGWLTNCNGKAVDFSY